MYGNIHKDTHSWMYQLPFIVQYEDVMVQYVNQRQLQD